MSADSTQYDPGEVKGIQILDEVARKAASNKAFRRRLLDNPKEQLRAAGIRVPNEVQVIVHVNTDTCINLVLPSKEPGTKVSLSELNVTKFYPWLHF
jgi:hypothetical protein